jgi:hypothetical protein
VRPSSNGTACKRRKSKFTVYTKNRTKHFLKKFFWFREPKLTKKAYSRVNILKKIPSNVKTNRVFNPDFAEWIKNGTGILCGG